MYYLHKEYCTPASVQPCPFTSLVNCAERDCELHYSLAPLKLENLNPTDFPSREQFVSEFSVRKRT